MKIHAEGVGKSLQTGRVNSCRRLVLEATNRDDRAALGRAVEEISRGRKATVILDGAADLVVNEAEEEQSS